ncbi:Hypothetical protein, putative [Bodo saltans]|uniref:Uncharacterized protein n=1 Tax=Bodo saltans TaxID=75058 RepID=A0A0S4KHJ3_BODSA|nr:Hypothetical protein, putative [Bodo saltans]|eukprot:CUI15149.1 Hypothetical protein, putative [Bodo saltans]
MGTKSIVKKAVKGLKKSTPTLGAKKTSSAASTKKKAVKRMTLKESSKKAAQKAPQRKQYEPEAKEKKKKEKRVRLTPLPFDENPLPVKKLLKKKRRTTTKIVIDDSATAYANPITAYLPAEEEQDQYIASRAIRGGQHEGSAALLQDPLADTGLLGIDFMKSYTEERGDEVKTEEALLEQAHQYFSQLNRDEQRRNNAAMKRLKEMKKINRAGGDKDGFRYVVPKNVSTIVRQLMVSDGVEGAQVDPETLGSTFGGDGVKETEAKPMRSKKARNQSFDDFYQFQVAKKWARNAESFLARGRANKNMFAAKQKQQRSIKKM